jgi:hypothetical protein
LDKKSTRFGLQTQGFIQGRMQAGRAFLSLTKFFCSDFLNPQLVKIVIFE